jgi:hypothetical protein
VLISKSFRQKGLALKVDQKVGAGNLRIGTENGGQASVEGRMLFVCVGGKVSKHTCKNNTKKSISSKQGKAFS